MKSPRVIADEIKAKNVQPGGKPMNLKTLTSMLASALVTSIGPSSPATGPSPIIRGEPRKVRGAGSGDSQKVDRWEPLTIDQRRFIRRRIH